MNISGASSLLNQKKEQCGSGVSVLYHIILQFMVLVIEVANGSKAHGQSYIHI